MTSRFVSLFKKNDLDEQRAFQHRVHGILAELYPDEIFTLSDDALTLENDGRVLGLTNLRSNFLLGSQSNSDLQVLVKAQFDPIFVGLDDSDRTKLKFDEVRSSLMPQLMPEAFLSRVKLVNIPFGDGVVLGFVIDNPEAYSYVSEEDRVRWDVDIEAIREVAFQNLSERSQGIEVAAFPGENGLFVVNTMDGFDAVRILSERLRDLVADHLGSPFYAGIPNRDFLICWSKNDDKEFQNNMRSQISSDFDERPYPLSRNAFEVSQDGSIEVAVFSGTDEKALSAELN